MTTFTKDSILTFGKYKGETVKSVIKDDPGYLMWACDEIEWFELDNDTFDELTTVYGEQSEDDGFPVVGWFDFD